MKRTVAAIVFALLTTPHASPQAGKGGVEGTVTRYGTNQPVANAQVRIGRSAVASRLPLQNVLGSWWISGTELSTVTDAQGRFAFPGLDSGDYVVQTWAEEGFSHFTSKPNEVSQYTEYAKRVTIGPGERIGDLSLSLAPLATLRGFIRGPNGQGVVGINVAIGTLEYPDRRRTWYQVEVTQTDDRGEYQFFRLRPGEYYVAVADRLYESVSEQGGRSSPFPPTYFPDALSMASALPVPVTIGSEIRADVELRAKPNNWRTISGKVMNGRLIREGPQLGPDWVSLLPRGDDTVLNLPVKHPTGLVDASGEFRIHDVAPGSYDLYAISRQWPHTYVGHIVVDVTDRDLTGITLAYDQRSAESVTGTIVDESGTVLRANSPMLLARRVIPDLNNSEVRGETIPPDHSVFQFTRVPPGTYDVTVGFGNLGHGHDARGERVYVADIRVGGQSVFDSGLVIQGTPKEPIEVIVRHGGGEVDVRVGGQRGRRGMLMLVPEAPQRENLHLYRDINTSGQTSFTFESVRPGRYKVFAIEGLVNTSDLDVAAFLSKHENDGVPVTVRERETVSVRVDLTPP